MIFRFFRFIKFIKKFIIGYKYNLHLLTILNKAGYIADYQYKALKWRMNWDEMKYLIIDKDEDTIDNIAVIHAHNKGEAKEKYLKELRILSRELSLEVINIQALEYKGDWFLHYLNFKK